MIKTKLKRYLFENDIKNRWLAEQTGIKEQTISELVNGKRKPSLDNALKIARVLGTTVEELWGDEVK
ncbi:helix-turn-helix transcriptional regulator [Alicyclobacillus tolerans]|uniref:helix-turn-helix transcriptional regulator n=1 Tax=Alicyclobacillus tolerans TaxID=90970 RepID=UPI001F39515A|nr:helix-turn-helix transcriptional regulator [Alicyclobacillus tolerans]MCF8564547.1 helix-turn-helix transcriptional regulator [Alicyclobacillus tolerans]